MGDDWSSNRFPSDYDSPNNKTIGGGWPKPREDYNLITCVALPVIYVKTVLLQKKVTFQSIKIVWHTFAGLALPSPFQLTRASNDSFAQKQSNEKPRNHQIMCPNDDCCLIYEIISFTSFQSFVLAFSFLSLGDLKIRFGCFCPTKRLRIALFCGSYARAMSFTEPLQKR